MLKTEDEIEAIRAQRELHAADSKPVPAVATTLSCALGDGLPRVVGPWRLLERLGTGAYGEVFAAETLEGRGLHGRVAIKLIDPQRAELETLQKRWEAKCLDAWKNPGQDSLWDRIGSG